MEKYSSSEKVTFSGLKWWKLKEVVFHRFGNNGGTQVPKILIGSHKIFSNRILSQKEKKIEGGGARLNQEIKGEFGKIKGGC